MKFEDLGCFPSIILSNCNLRGRGFTLKTKNFVVFALSVESDLRGHQSHVYLRIWIMWHKERQRKEVVQDICGFSKNSSESMWIGFSKEED